MTALIYIGGYGRSGSTLLETLLATRSDVLACGEVASALGKRKDRPCTCGMSRHDCDVWGPFYKEPQRIRGLDHEALVSALLSHAAHRYTVVVDSSKTAWGTLKVPFKLWRRFGPKFHLVHIVRDPHGVCWSNASGAWRRRNSLMKSVTVRHLKSSLGWWAANLSCELFRCAHPEQYQRVRYEDLARSPAEIRNRLLAQMSPEQGRPDGTATNNRHQLFGNQGRHREVDPSNIREDVRWRTEMPAWQRVLVSILTWPLRRRYGY